jgi:hypothetical protein
MRAGRHRPQRNWGARLREYDVQGMRAVFLENERLRVGVLADRGTDVIEFNYKPRDLDFVWLSSGGVRNPTSYVSTSPDPLGTFMDHYPGGWQEVLPNGGPPTTYRGATFGQHGEIAQLPWDYDVVADEPAAVAVRFRVRGQKSPLLVEKTMRLEAGSPRLAVTERAVNDSPVAYEAMWGQHLAFGPPFLAPGCRITLPADATVLPHPEPIAPGGRRVAAGRAYAWPLAQAEDGTTVDLSVVPEHGVPSEMLYVTDLPEGRYALTRPDLGVGVAVEWDLDVMPYLWVWAEHGATTGYPWYGRHYNLGLEPFSSHPTGGLSEAVANGSALRFPPGAERPFAWTVTVEDDAAPPPHTGSDADAAGVIMRDRPARRGPAQPPTGGSAAGSEAGASRSDRHPVRPEPQSPAEQAARKPGGQDQ